MKRKNMSKGSTDTSEEETSNDYKQIGSHCSDSEGDGEVITFDEAEDNDDLNGSATESDEEESDVSTEFEDVQPKKTKSEKVKDAILQRYQERQGKQLYIRFPFKVPETQEALEEKVRELTPLVVKVHKPRQRHARFCLIDFTSKQDRDTALSKLKKSIKNGDLKKYVVNIPRTESSDFVKELTERKLKSIENKKDKQRLKKASKKYLNGNNFTSTVVVLNLPKSASMLQIREVFANAIDINIKHGKGKLNKDKSIAAITFPTTLDARNAIKKKLSLGGNQLVIKFDNKSLNKSKNNSKDFSKNYELNQVSKPAAKKIKLQPPIYNTIGKSLKNHSVAEENKSDKVAENISKAKTKKCTAK